MASSLRPSGEDNAWFDRLIKQWRQGKTHDTQCDEISELISVEEFKRGCAEITESQLEPLLLETEHLEQECDPGQLLVREGGCHCCKRRPPRGLEPILKLEQRDLPQNSPLQCLSQPKALKKHLHRRNPLLNAVQSDSHAVPAKSSAVLTSGEVLLNVFLYHPIRKHKEEEFVVLGSQRLVELRDVINCRNDYLFSEDFSEKPLERLTLAVPPPPNRSTSAFFFINNTFYNDMRHPQAIDYSRKILDWCRELPDRIETSPRLDHFTTADMASTTFDTLSLRLGYPYLFCHHGNCEHIIVFNDLRKLHSTDNQCPDNYPLLRFQRRHKRCLCCVCGGSEPVWVTCNDSLATESPALFCHSCFVKLHYSEAGRKLTDFQAFPHFPGSY